MSRSQFSNHQLNTFITPSLSKLLIVCYKKRRVVSCLSLERESCRVYLVSSVVICTMLTLSYGNIALYRPPPTSHSIRTITLRRKQMIVIFILGNFLPRVPRPPSLSHYILVVFFHSRVAGFCVFSIKLIIIIMHMRKNWRAIAIIRRPHPQTTTPHHIQSVWFFVVSNRLVSSLGCLFV